MRSKAFHTARKYISLRKLVRARELEAFPGWRKVRGILLLTGGVQEVGWGIYAAANLNVSPIALAAFCADGAIVALQSAMDVHGLPADANDPVTLAIENRARPPSLPTYVRGEFVRFSGKAWREDVEWYAQSGVACPVYSLPKTVVDCFRLARRLPRDFPARAARHAVDVAGVPPSELLERAKQFRLDRAVRAALYASEFSDFATLGDDGATRWERVDPGAVEAARAEAVVRALRVEEDEREERRLARFREEWARAQELKAQIAARRAAAGIDDFGQPISTVADQAPTAASTDESSQPREPGSAERTGRDAANDNRELLAAADELFPWEIAAIERKRRSRRRRR